MHAPEHSFGEVFTRRWVVDVLLDLTGYRAERDLASLRLLEPACGTGAFLGPVVERLISSARRHGHRLDDLEPTIRAYDLQACNVLVARRLCAGLLTAAGMATTRAEALTAKWVSQADFLLAADDDRPTDVAVGNPPYIRYDDLPESTAAEYRRRWPTMRGRGDIFVGFIERCL